MSQRRVWSSLCRSNQSVCTLFALETVSWCQAPTAETASPTPLVRAVYWFSVPIRFPPWRKSEASAPFAGENWKKL